MRKADAIFLGAVLLGAGGVLVAAGVIHHRAEAVEAASAQKPDLHRLTGDIWVTAQIAPAQLKAIHDRGIAGVIDLRPDGEVAGQPSSAAVGRTAAALGLQFRYVPVPHGDIPSAVVDQLASDLAATPRPLLLYCHSGRRAARTWALAEASRVDGMDAKAIEVAVHGAGQSADDLQSEIARRVEARPAGVVRGVL